jgi:hypothetical protein
MNEGDFTWLRSTIYVIIDLSLPFHAMLWQ